MRRYIISLIFALLIVPILSAQSLLIFPTDLSALEDRAHIYKEFPLRLIQSLAELGEPGGGVSIADPVDTEEYLSGFSILEEDRAGESIPVAEEYGLLLRISPPSIQPQTDTIVAEARLVLRLLALDRNLQLETQELRGLGLADTKSASLAEAEEELFKQLLNYLQTCEYLNLRGPIARIEGDRILLRIGRDAGLRRGDELESPSKALVRIDEVGREYAFASPIYGQVRPEESLRSLDRTGLELEAYTRGVISPELDAEVVSGIKLALSRWGGLLHPVIGMEMPATLVPAAEGITLFPYAGLEYSLRRGRWELLPGGAFGIGYRSGGNGTAGPSHIGGFGSCEVTFLFHRDWRLAFTGGYAYWLGTNLLEEEERYSYNGVMAGLGLVWKL